MAPPKLIFRNFQDKNKKRRRGILVILLINAVFYYIISEMTYKLQLEKHYAIKNVSFLFYYALQLLQPNFNP